LQYPYILIVTTGLDPVVHDTRRINELRLIRMDCRVKPGNDE
jgi:hypothetical protein